MATPSAHARRKMVKESPSRCHGIDAVMEERLRRSYTRFMQRLGRALRLPQQPTIAAATLLCHRFFLRQSHAKNDSLLIASACLFLASKSEDSHCRLAHIAGASYNQRFGARTSVKNSFVLEDDNLQKESERRILLAEHLVLCTLGFELEVRLPYKPLFSILRMLRESVAMQQEYIKLGECQLKSHKEEKGHMLKLDQFAMDVDESTYKHRNVRCSGADGRDGKVGAGYDVTLNNANGKSRQPGPTDFAVGFNHAGAIYHGSTFAQSRAAVEHFNNDKHEQSRITSDHTGTYANDLAHTRYLNRGEAAFHQVAWNFVNDTLLSLMCLQFKPRQIAAGAVWLAAKFLGVQLPSEGERPWWKGMEVTPLELEEIGTQFLEVYSAENETKLPKGLKS